MSKTLRGNASQFFVAGELCRRGLVAVVTLGNTPNTDILCSNVQGTKFVHIQVKTFVPGNGTVSVGEKAEQNYGRNFVWVLAGIPEKDQHAPFEYFIIPSRVMSQQVKDAHDNWLGTPGKQGQPHNKTSMRVVHLPPNKSSIGWSVNRYRDKWSIIENLLWGK